MNLKEDIYLNNILLFEINKNTIIKNFGKPINISKPEYECGSYSNETQNAVFETLNYTGFQFIGSNNSVYSLENINFKNLPEKQIFRIKNIILNKEIKQEEAVKEFKKYYNFNKEDNFLIFPTNSDFKLILEFENNKLSKCYFEESC
ncbi:hypothetical protein [Empedobacter sedimenti]|uniref:hypothetical protein n=1 Tax=Empedobacter sedimenti TaxID=3042610 RepID=UPI0024A6C387|nr:hypothetical protein [Empedobacter sedimenti]